MQSDLHHAIKLYTHMQFLKLHVSHLNITTLKDKTRGPMGRIDHLKKKKTPRDTKRFYKLIDFKQTLN